MADGSIVQQAIDRIASLAGLNFSDSAEADEFSDQAHSVWVTSLQDALPDVEAAEESAWTEGRPIQLLPGKGSWRHPRYGTVSITDSDLNDFVSNFNAQVRGQHLPIGIEHQPEHGAIARIKNVFRDGDKLMATPEWTSRGVRYLKENRFWYISAEFMREWTNATQQKFKNVLFGAAVTNNPFFKGMQEVTLSEEIADQVIDDTAPETHTEVPTVPDPTQPIAGAGAGAGAGAETPPPNPDPTPTPPTPDPTPTPPVSAPPAVPAQQPINMADYVPREEFIRLHERFIASERRTRLAEFREQFSHWSGEPDANAELMLSLSEAVEEQMFTAVRDRIESLERQVAQSELYHERGTSRAPANGNSPQARLDAAYQAEKAANPDASEEDLWVAVATKHPQLYTEYRMGFRGQAPEA